MQWKQKRHKDTVRYYTDFTLWQLIVFIQRLVFLLHRTDIMQNFKSREIWLLIQALGVKICCIIARSAGLILCGRPTTSLGQTQRVASLAALVLPVCGMTCLPMREDHASRKIIIGVGFGLGM